MVSALQIFYFFVSSSFFKCCFCCFVRFISRVFLKTISAHMAPYLESLASPSFLWTPRSKKLLFTAPYSVSSFLVPPEANIQGLLSLESARILLWKPYPSSIPRTNRYTHSQPRVFARFRQAIAKWASATANQEPWLNARLFPEFIPVTDWLPKTANSVARRRAFGCVYPLLPDDRSASVSFIESVTGYLSFISCMSRYHILCCINDDIATSLGGLLSVKLMSCTSCKCKAFFAKMTDNRLGWWGNL